MQKTVLIAGITGGIGEACRDAFVSDGWRVVGLTRGRPALSETVSELYHNIDYHDLESVRRAVRAIVEKSERLDAVVHAIGDIYQPTSVKEIDMQRWYDSFHVCVGTAVNLMRSTFDRIAEVGGAYVFISSIASAHVYPGIADYCAAKAALAAFSRCMAAELAPHGARSNCISPAVVDTKLFHKSSYSVEEASSWHKLGRIGDPKEIASLALFLAKPSSSWITGQDYIIDGGMLL